MPNSKSARGRPVALYVAAADLPAYEQLKQQAEETGVSWSKLVVAAVMATGPTLLKKMKAALLANAPARGRRAVN